MILLVRLFTRSLLGRRRTLALVALAVIPGLIAAAEGATDAAEDPLRFTARLLERFFLPTVVALVTLVLAASVFGDERDDGTIVYVVSTPLPRRSIVVAGFLSAWIVALLILVPVAIACAALPGATDTRGVLSAVVATALTTGAYAAVFGWLALRIRRPVIVGFLYILLWEASIAGFAPSAARLSVAAYGRAIVAAGLDASDRFNVPDVSALGAPNW